MGLHLRRRRSTALEPRFIVLVVLPLAALLVFATAIKLVLSAGLRVPAITLLVFAAVALVAASVDVVVPTTDGFELINGRATKLLWTSHGKLLGAAALHPSFAHATRAMAGAALSPWRVVLFAVTAVIVPLALAVGLAAEPDSLSRSTAGIAIPTAAAAAVLLALI